MGALNYAQALVYNMCVHLYTHTACRFLIRPGHMIEGFVPPISFDTFKFQNPIRDITKPGEHSQASLLYSKQYSGA